MGRQQGQRRFCKARTANSTMLLLSLLLYLHCLFCMITKQDGNRSALTKRYLDGKEAAAAATFKKQDNVQTNQPNVETMRVLLGIERIDKRSFPMIQSTSWGKIGSTTIVPSSPSPSSSSLFSWSSITKNNYIPSMRIDVTRYNTKYSMIETGRYDWYVHCPSTVYINVHSLRNELAHLYQHYRDKGADANIPPIYFGMLAPTVSANNTNDRTFMHQHDERFCRIWNWATAEQLMQHCSFVKGIKKVTMAKAKTIDSDIDQCILLKGNVKMASFINQRNYGSQNADDGSIIHRPSPKFASRCFPEQDGASSPMTSGDGTGDRTGIVALSSSWMKENAFPGRCPGNLGYFLSREYSHLFYKNSNNRHIGGSDNHQNNNQNNYDYFYKDAVECKCTFSTTNEVLRSCGWLGSKDDRLSYCSTDEERLAAGLLPSCYVNDDYYSTTKSHVQSDKEVENYNSDIPAYVISLNQTLAQQRLDTYMPKIPFQTQQVIDAVRIPTNGQEGYRQSMAKALQEGLLSNSDLFAIFDDDFRVDKNFDKKWNDLVTSSSSSFCYHDTLVNRGGVLLLGASIWSTDMFDFLFMKGSNNTIDSNNRYYVHPNTNSESNAVCYDAQSLVKGSFAAIYSKNAAQHILTWLNVTSHLGGTRAYDWVWGDIIELGLFPVRVLFDHLFVADVGHSSSVNTKRRSVGPTLRHRKMRWGPVNSYWPESGAY